MIQKGGHSIMAGTFSQIYIHYVFAVRGRHNLLQKSWRNEVFKYMSGIIKGKGQNPIIVNGVADHVHIFVRLKPAMSISELARDIKNNSSNFINDRNYLDRKFSWQEGYGAFSYAHSQIENVYHYIANQEEHHRKKTFKEEYVRFSGNLKLSMMKNIYLIGWNENVTPSGFYFVMDFIRL